MLLCTIIIQKTNVSNKVMAADKMDEILKHFPDLEDGWKEMQEMIEKKIIEPAEMDMLCLKYRERLEREKLKESLPEPEFTKAKRAESDSKVMKANEMPERIYLFDYNDAMVTPLEGDTVYVREDAFIEKAAEWLSEIENGTTITDIDKFVEDFKKAMKL